MVFRTAWPVAARNTRIPRGAMRSFVGQNGPQDRDLIRCRCYRLPVHRQVSKWFLAGQDGSPSADALSVAFHSRVRSLIAPRFHETGPVSVNAAGIRSLLLFRPRWKCAILRSISGDRHAIPLWKRGSEWQWRGSRNFQWRGIRIVNGECLAKRNLPFRGNRFDIARRLPKVSTSCSTN